MAIDSLPPKAAFSRLIVCERLGQWGAALRLELADADVRLFECRTLADAWEALAETPAAFVVAEATHENLDALLRPFLRPSPRRKRKPAGV